ncbi:hypothetical protein GCM10007859_08010 [Brevundimonas denitrificans]|uniref:Uncharacterized protein n=1 Tax=Brevundimonas denitrificans TaxID=1443434 RepID=A0ABQ6BH62_9CAUL|nr:hypothetical protein GCM10007859_08010 [Brevundimonas denitrificans]
MFRQGRVVFQQEGAATGEDIAQLGERIVAVDACHFPVHRATPAFTDDTALKRNDNAQRTAFAQTRTSALAQGMTVPDAGVPAAAAGCIRIGSRHVA